MQEKKIEEILQTRSRGAEENIEEGNVITDEARNSKKKERKEADGRGEERRKPRRG